VARRDQSTLSWRRYQHTAKPSSCYLQRWGGASYAYRRRNPGEGLDANPAGNDDRLEQTLDPGPPVAASREVEDCPTAHARLDMPRPNRRLVRATTRRHRARSFASRAGLFGPWQSIILGEFNRGGRLKVVYLPPQQPGLLHPMKLRLNADRLSAHQGNALEYLLDLCWAPRELCLRWLLVRQITPPPWLVAEPIRIIRAPQHKASMPAAASASIPSRASEDRVHTAIDFVYASATGKPPNLKQLVPLAKAQLDTTNHLASWKEIEHCAKDLRHAGKRRPRGRTVKSERATRPHD
jgi:hypothetical protein